jgi:hypothetical protein
MQMESRFFSAFLHRMKQGLIMQQAKSRVSMMWRHPSSPPAI